MSPHRLRLFSVAALFLIYETYFPVDNKFMEKQVLTLDKASKIIQDHQVSTSLVIIGIRGFSSDANKRGIYDDLIAVVMMKAGETSVDSFNANCDPQYFQPGIANLKEGVWQYKLGIHGLNKPKEKQYKALVQAAPVTVARDAGKEETGMFGINIHRGSLNSVSSLGCQTIPPTFWESFLGLVESKMTKLGLNRVPYILTKKFTDLKKP